MLNIMIYDLLKKISIFLLRTFFIDYFIKIANAERTISLYILSNLNLKCYIRLKKLFKLYYLKKHTYHLYI